LQFEIFAIGNLTRFIRKFVTEENRVSLAYRGKLHSATPEWKVRVKQVLKILRWKSIAGQERSPRRHITDEDDISQPIIAYIEICDLQHNGRRAARISASPLLWDLLVVPTASCSCSRKWWCRLSPIDRAYLGTLSLN